MNNTLLFLLFVLTAFTLKAEESAQALTLTETEEPEEGSSVMPKYGHWCGRNHPKDPEHADEPINTLDASCKKHDLCYLEKGHMACECDSEFNNEVVAYLKENRLTGTEKVLAHTFRAYFRGSPCFGNPKDKLAPTRLVTGVVKKADQRTEQIIRRIKRISKQTDPAVE
jgi:hypothetical protein